MPFLPTGSGEGEEVNSYKTEANTWVLFCSGGWFLCSQLVTFM